MFSILRFGQTSGHTLPSSRWQRRRSLRVEELESRTLLTAYAPSQIRHAYGFDKLPYDGSGQTIAIVVAYDNPALSYDLGEFDQLFGLPDPVVTVAQPQGQPSYDEGWGLEIDLDVEWAHAIAPAANILLVEAKNTFLSSLLSAVDYARNQPGVVAVSMSWARPELLSESRYDSHFTTPPGHIGGSGLPGGITFVAASGDYGAGAVWPAASPNVLGIGGTTLTLDDQDQIASETGWSDSGGGISNYEPQPAYQVPFQTTYGMRTTPDFSYDADPSTAYWTYDSNYGGTTAVYGTSAGAPQWAALIALADQGLAMNNIGSLDGPSQTIPALYHLASISYATYYYDITEGNNGYQAGPGYDLVTGIGSPVADQVVQGLVNGAQAPFGGARGPRGSTIRLIPQAGLTSVAIPPASLPQLEVVTAPLGTVPDGMLLLRMSDSLSVMSQEEFSAASSSTQVVQRSTDQSAASLLTQQTLLPLAGLAESRSEMSESYPIAFVKDMEKDPAVPSTFELVLGTATIVPNGLPGP